MYEGFAKVRKSTFVYILRFYYKLWSLGVSRRLLKNARTEEIFTKQGTLLLRKIKDEDFKGGAFSSSIHSVAGAPGVKKNSLTQPMKDFVKASPLRIRRALPIRNPSENLHYEMRPPRLTDGEVARSQRVARIKADLGVM